MSSSTLDNAAYVDEVSSIQIASDCSVNWSRNLGESLQGSNRQQSTIYDQRGWHTNIAKAIYWVLLGGSWQATSSARAGRRVFEYFGIRLFQTMFFCKNNTPGFQGSRRKNNIWWFCGGKYQVIINISQIINSMIFRSTVALKSVFVTQKQRVWLLRFLDENYLVW